MKKFLIALLVVVLCLSVLRAQAMETNVYTCSPSSYSSRCDIVFDTYRTGEVTVNVQWTPTSKGKYSLDVYNADNTSQWCDYTTDISVTPPPGDWTCHFPVGDIGQWHVYFNPIKGGRVDAVITITAETDI